jgi:hypothetical protein
MGDDDDADDILTTYPHLDAYIEKSGRLTHNPIIAFSKCSQIAPYNSDFKGFDPLLWRMMPFAIIMVITTIIMILIVMQMIVPESLYIILQRPIRVTLPLLRAF